MKYPVILGLAIAFLFSATVANANERDFDTIENAPVEKERGMPSEQFNNLTEVLRDTPNGDKVMRILKKKLPGIIN